MGACPELSVFTNLNSTNSISVNNADPNAVYVNGNGEFTYDQLAVLEKNFTDGIVDNSQNNSLSDAVGIYGSEDFYTGLGNFNNSLTNTGGSLNNALNNNADKYDVVYRVFQNGRSITPFEFAQFLLDYNYTPTTVVNSNSTNVLTNLNNFYNGPFSASIMGGFCGTFATIAAAVTMFDQLANFTKDALVGLNKIKGWDPETIIQAAIDKLTNIANIKALKENILKAIDGAAQSVMNAVKNFDISNIVGQVEAFVNNNIVKRVTKIKEQILSFFEGDFVEKIKNKVSSLIDYATNLFKNPTLETIQYMIARFCGMASLVEQMMEDTKKPLDQFAQKYSKLFGTMKNSSNVATARALENGAIRFSDQRRKELINKINETNYQPPRTTGANDTSNSEEENEIPDISGRLQRPVTDRERMALPTWEDLLANSDPRIWHAGTGETFTYYSQIQENGPGPCQIWEEMSQDMRCLLLRVQTRWGKKLRLHSGFRGNGANEWLRGFKSGVAENSKHKFGIAADVSWPGMNLKSQRAFRKIAIEEGFRGVGIYGSFVHVDTRDVLYTWFG
jgi:5'(3')-deoxyribonucleotidase